MTRLQRALLAASGLLALLGAAAVGARVSELERGELEHLSEARSLEALAGASGSTRVSARLTQLSLRTGDVATFEVCARDPLSPERFREAFELVVWRLPEAGKAAAPELMLRVPLDDAHLATARRSRERACLVLGGGVIEQAGRYALDAVWPNGQPAPSVTRVPLQARVLVRAPLQALDRLRVLAIAVAALLLVLALAIGPRTASTQDAQTPRAGRALGGAALGLLVLYLASQVETPGSALTLAKGVALALLQIGGALVLARWLLGPEPLDALAGRPPAARIKWSLLSAVCAAGLVLAARVSLALVPATGEAPIQTFVSWPSGLLSFAALGVILPVGEEIFFRGYLYRAALVLGRPPAFLLTTASFVLLHAPQSWGNWGGLLAIAITGVVLTALRAGSGSLLAPLLAHLLYNFVLSFGSF